MSATELLDSFNKDKAEINHTAEMLFHDIVKIISKKLGKGIGGYFSYCFESYKGEYVKEIVVANGSIRRYATINFVFDKVIIYCTIITTNYMGDVDYNDILAEDVIDILIYTKHIFIKCELRKK